MMICAIGSILNWRRCITAEIQNDLVLIFIIFVENRPTTFLRPLSEPAEYFYTSPLLSHNRRTSQVA